MNNNKKYNFDMDELTQLMVITMEECGELIQECSKLLRIKSRTGTVSKESLISLTKEAADVRAMISLMEDHGLVMNKEVKKGMNNKIEKLKTWSSLVV
tara:strand:+ start:408 stop:701 length:294 start_codon:yes stop_codon:yes gene_type:complete